MSYEIEKSEAEWRAQLGDERYFILREKGTEPAFTGSLLNNKREGTYLCAGCEDALFSSDTKYDSGSGWPSFSEPIDAHKLATRVDRQYGMVRIEIICRRCGGHLGHVFDDGIPPTGLRYCINSAALIFKEATN